MRRAIFNGVSPRSIITSPKPPLCKSRSPTRNPCSTGFSIVLFFSVTLCLCGESGLCKCPHRTQSSLSKFTPAAAAEGGLKASLISTRAHTSCRWVAAAKVANNTLVRPDEAGPTNLGQASARKSAGKRIDLADAARNHLRSGPHFQSRRGSHPCELGHCR